MRRNRILSEVEKAKEIRVEELASICGVSPMTVRRDLQFLSDRGALVRLHGRAAVREQSEAVPESSRTVQFCRDCISAYAAGLVSDGDALFINGSRTALNLLKYIRGKKVSVRTNNGYALFDHYGDDIRLHLIGGELHRNVMIGEYVVQNLLQMSADKTFLGCAAVYDDGEFRYDIPTEIGINEIMISRTRGSLYILADHSKLKFRKGIANAYGSFRYNCPVTLLTDNLADETIVQHLSENGIHVIRVPVPHTAGK